MPMQQMMTSEKVLRQWHRNFTQGDQELKAGGVSYCAFSLSLNGFDFLRMTEACYWPSNIS